jgi:hypothetical protein
MQEHDMKRRTFVQATVAGAAGAMVGIQIGMGSFGQPDYEKVLDLAPGPAWPDQWRRSTAPRYPGRNGRADR